MGEAGRSAPSRILSGMKSLFRIPVLHKLCLLVYDRFIVAAGHEHVNWCVLLELQINVGSLSQLTFSVLCFIGLLS